MKACNYQNTIPVIALVTSFLLASAKGNPLGKIIKCQCKVHEPETIQNVSCWSKSFNRTYTVANVRAYIPRPIPNVLVNFQLFKKTGLIYRPFLINVTEDYCAFFAKNKASQYLRIFGSIYLPYSNLNHTCPYEGNIFIKDVPLSVDKLPSLWPPGVYRLDVNCIQPPRFIVTMEFFIEMKEKLHTWRR